MENDSILWGSLKGSRKKKFFFSGPTTKGGGVRARPLRKKELFKTFFLFVAVEKLNILC